MWGMMTRRGLMGGALGSLCVVAGSAAQERKTADRILMGRVRTLDEKNTVGEAIAIAGDRVLAVGSRAAVLRTRRRSTVVREIAGATIIPGFNDAHAHLEREGLKTLRPSLSGAKSVADVLRRIEEIARGTPARQWIVTMPVGEPPFYFGGPAVLAEKRMPTREELDRAAPNHPVCIAAPFGFWGEPPTYTALNTAGLKLNGIDGARRPVVDDVEIVHGADGEPTGVILNKGRTPAAEFDLLRAVPRFTFDDRMEGLRRAQKLYHSHGTTSVYEGHGEAAESIAVYRELWERGELTMRTGLCLSPSWSGLAEADKDLRDWAAYARGSGFGDAMLRMGGIHIAFGGEGKVAALSRAQLPDTGWSGQVEQVVTPGDYEELCMMAARYELRVHTIVADRLEEVIAVLERVAKKTPLAGRRWVIEHIAKCREQDVESLKRLGLGATLIPVNYLWKGGSRFLGEGAEAARLISPAKKLLALGVPVAAGTDNIPYDPAFTLWAMTHRVERTTGRVIGAEGRVTNEQALRLMTTAGAWLTFEENVKGALKPGNYADLAVMGADPVTAGAEELKGLKCSATMVGGRVVHGEL